MFAINRVAVVVEPNEPYYAWARQLDEGEPSIDDMVPEDLCSVYLIEWAEAPEPVLRHRFDYIFEEKLNAWHRVPADWPQRRTYKMFRQWFHVRLVDQVLDLEVGPIVQDDF